MNGSNLVNASENSYLCLVAIYAIHVALIHVYLPSDLSPRSSVTLPLHLQPMARWRMSPAGSGLPLTRRNGSRDFFGEAPIDDESSNAINDTTYDKPSAKSNVPNRLLGGVVASLGQFPHQVSLRRSRTGVHFCGGSIIDEEWIVTAAHCMYSNNRPIAASTVEIYAGNLLLDKVSTSTSQRRTVQEIIINQNFDLDTLRNDIALLKLRSKLVLNDESVAAKSLRNESVADDTPCQVSGWGVSQYKNAALSNDLLYIDIPIVNRTLCQKLMANFSDIPQVMICAGYIGGGIDSCQGDSGGGMICDDVLTGVVSWGKDCGLANFPGIYTNVHVFNNWIVETIAKNSSSPISVRNSLSPAAWGVIMGCLAFLFTYTEGERVENETKD